MLIIILLRLECHSWEVSLYGGQQILNQFNLLCLQIMVIFFSLVMPDKIRKIQLRFEISANPLC